MPTHEMKFYTDYPFVELGDAPGKEAPVREVELISYDGNKYVKIMVEGINSEIKSGYIYTAKGRYGEVPTIKPSTHWPIIDTSA